jgi:hypothetical protein
MTEVPYSIARQFSRHPGPRYRRQGPHSGEALRTKLARILRTNPDSTLIIDLDGTSGYGGLVRSEGFERSVQSRFRFKSSIDPSYITEITESFERAQPN